MERDNAVTALDEDSMALMERKLDFTWRAIDPAKRTGTFARVLEATGLPSFDDSVRERAINIERFLVVRDSAECHEFRSFLNQSENLNPAELRERTASLRAKIGHAVQTTTGKAVRFLATTAVGLFTGGVASAGAGAADTFLVEKLFPKSGVVTFVGKQYPSIFEK
jgi:hypothetical protein